MKNKQKENPCFGCEGADCLQCRFYLNNLYTDDGTDEEIIISEENDGTSDTRN